MSNWTQPVCEACWCERVGDREPVTLLLADVVELCCYCGLPTTAGIYVRVDPATVGYPSPDEDD